MFSQRVTLSVAASPLTWTIQAEVTAAGLVLTLVIFWATRARDRRIRQAELLRNYTNDFYGDDSMTQIFMDVDHERYAFSDAQYGQREELALIRLLDFFNVIGHNWARGVMRMDTLIDTTLGYAAVRLHTNDSVSAYLRQVETWDAERYAFGTGFRHFRELAVAIANYPAAPSGPSFARRVSVGVERRIYVRRARFFSPARISVPRPVAVTSAEVLEATAPTSAGEAEPI